ncbi:hypothetical protein KIMH_14990 [Bombiscardovia apis]|uniref:Acetyl-CoA carboxylase n=1 Tax=Bombiscardovia apis TaxID=2932182 RepID=A0ABN6SI29_9BIFI|nr:hypothetical protein KIMH_14990 [Bombiscardovia apis]
MFRFDSDRLMVEFRQQAGLDTKGVKNYGGWERGYSAETNPDGTDQPPRFTGHFVGHYLSAISHALQASFASEQERRKLATIQRVLVENLRQTQEAYAQKDPANAGFLPAFRVDALPGGKDGLIVPFYNLHKLLQGLIDAAGSAPYGSVRLSALAAAGDFADFVIRWHKAHPGIDMLAIEYGGMNEALYRLYALTGKPTHLEAAQLFDELPLFEVLAAGEDCLPGLHANATIPKLIGAVTRYQVLGCRAEDDLYLRAARNFWELVADRHTYANGSNSQAEHFHQPGALWEDATTNGNADGGYNDNSTCETCNAHNMLKLTRLLLELTGEAKYSNYYQQTFTNAILASQDPESGMTTYFQPMQAGYPKVFGVPFGEFWCCQGTGIENFTQLGDSAYLLRNHAVVVNQFVSSTVEDYIHGLLIRQEAHLPQESVVHFTIDALDFSKTSQCADFAAATKRSEPVLLRLPIPDWVESNDIALEIDGSQVKPSNVMADGWLTFPIMPGMRLQLTLPARLRFIEAPDNPNWIAFAYGPVLLAGVLGPTDATSNYSYGGILVRVGKFNAQAAQRAQICLPQGLSREHWLEHIESHIQPVEPPTQSISFAFTLDRGPVNSTSESGRISEPLLLLPYYQLHRSLYALYFDLDDGRGGEAIYAKCEQDSHMRIIDSLTPDQGNNIERSKKLKASANSRSLVAGGRTFRDADTGGWFSYELAVDKRSDKNYIALLTDCPLEEFDSSEPADSGAFAVFVDPCPDLCDHSSQMLAGNEAEYSRQAVRIAAFRLDSAWNSSDIDRNQQDSAPSWHYIGIPASLVNQAPKPRIRVTLSSVSAPIPHIYGLRVAADF